MAQVRQRNVALILARELAVNVTTPMWMWDEAGMLVYIFVHDEVPDDALEHMLRSMRDDLVQLEALIEVGVRCVIAAGWAVEDKPAELFATQAVTVAGRPHRRAGRREQAPDLRLLRQQGAAVPGA